MRNIRTVIVALALATLTVLAGCSNGSGEEDMAADFVGRWQAEVEYGGPHEPFLEIEESGDWSGSDGCNQTIGTWEIDAEGNLNVTAGPSTLMGCEGKPLPSLFALGTAEVVNEQLVLYNDDGREEIRLVKQ